MEYLNRVTLRGIVGAVKTTQACGTAITRLTVVTNHGLTGADGYSIIETQWHNVTAFGGKDIQTDGLARGAVVEVTGRLRQQRYTTATGEERSGAEVLASSLKVLGPSAEMKLNLQND